MMNRNSERGNIFFMLFGAVALVGVVAAATSTLMRGPLSTVVNVNSRAKADTQMQIAAKLAMVRASQQSGPGTPPAWTSGDCDMDGNVEPIPARDATPKPAGGGQLPESIGASQLDPWGTPYGYCVWDIGSAHGQAGCTPAGGEVARLDGGYNNNYPVMVIVSAGPDRNFQTACNAWTVTDTDPIYSDTKNYPDNVVGTVGSQHASPNVAGDVIYKPVNSDDIMISFSYDQASQVAGGLWSIKAGDPSKITTNRDVDVQTQANFASTTTFQGAARFDTGSRLDLGFGGAGADRGGLFFLPDDSKLQTCNSANNGALRLHVIAGHNSLEVCDGATGWSSPTASGLSVSKIDDLTDAIAGTTAHKNIMLGDGTGLNFTSASASDNNVGVGIGSLTSLAASGALNNTVIGSSSGNALVGGDNNILIGSGIDVPSGATSGYLSIGNMIFANGMNGATGTTASATGNVGIGTATPTAKLQVAGETQATRFQFDSNTYLGYSSGGDMTLTYGGTSQMFVNSTGVGVGVSPTHKFDVDGDAYADRFVATYASASTSPVFTFAGDITSGLSHPGGGTLGFMLSGSERGRFNSTGLGIGTTSPSSALDVVGAGAFTSTVTATGFQFDSTGAYGMYGGGGNIRFDLGGATRAVMTTTGLGVGIASPNVAVDINGAVRLAFTSASCGASIYGAIRYSSDTLEYCAATPTAAWTPIISAGGGGGSFNLWTDNTTYITRATGHFINSGAALPAALSSGGSRFFWYPDKSSLRAGGTSGSDWSDLNIGLFSTGLGYDTRASGDYSLAAGHGTIASGNDSVALGRDVIAGGANSFAFGLGASGATHPTVSGNNSLGIFMGNQANRNITASNQMSLVGGKFLIDAAPAFASSTTIGGSLSMDVNGDVGAEQYCDSDGNYCFTAASIASGAVGVFENASNVIRLTSGTVNYASASYVFGSPQMASDGNAAHDSRFLFYKSLGAFRAGAAAGTQWDAGNVGNYSTAFGYSTMASGAASFAAGSGVSVAGIYGVALGVNARANGTSSMAVGLGAAAGAYPVVTGTGSYGIFMGDQSGITLSSSSTMGLFGGRFVIDPKVPATQLTARGVLDLGGATDAMVMPVGTTGERPGAAASVNGMIRYNTTSGKFEAYQAGAWQDILTGAIAGGAAAPDRGIQFNSGNSFAAVSNFIYTSAGRVGIGTLTPNTLTNLDVATGININNGTNSIGQIRSSTGHGRLLINDSNGTTAVSLGPYNSGSANFIAVGTGLTVGSTTMARAALDVGYTTSAFIPSIGDTSQRPATSVNGMLRYNSASANFEGYQGGFWLPFSSGGSPSTTTAINDLTDAVTLYSSGNMYLGTGVGATSTTASYNTSLGAASMQSVLTGGNNTAFGYNALNAQASGTDNVAFGMNALATTTNGNYNTALGRSALGNTGLGSDNVAVGYLTLSNNSAGRESTAVGSQALRYSWNSVSGFSTFSTAVGFQALRGSTTASNNTGLYNTAVGHTALMNYTSGGSNTAVGQGALTAVNTGVANTALGRAAGSNLTTGGGNIMIGYNILASAVGVNNELNIGNLITGDMSAGLAYISSTSAIKLPVGTTAERPSAGVTVNGMIRYNSGSGKFEGYQAGAWQDILTTGGGTTAIDDLSDAITQYSSGNMYLGQSVGSSAAGLYNTMLGYLSYSSTAATGSNNTGYGYSVLRTGGSGGNNVAMGSSALYSNTSGNDNTAVGLTALIANTGGSLNTAYGSNSMHNNVTGNNNVAVGYGALVSNVGKHESTAVGYYAMQYGDSATGSVVTYNTAIGAYALRGSTTASNNIGIANTAVGHSALTAGTSGSYNTAVGRGSLSATNSGSYNAGFGHSVLQNNSSGSYNAGMGMNALSGNTTGSNNTGIGYNAGNNITTGSSNIMIGSGVLAPTASTSNSLNIGNLITGDMSIGLAYISSTSAIKLPVGTTAERPSAGVTVNGMIRYNSGSGKFEGYQAGAWQDILTTGGGTTAIDDLSDAITQYTSGGSMYFGSGVGAGATGGFNTVTGYNAFQTASTAIQHVTAYGYEAMRYVYSSGSGANMYNTAFGEQALRGSITATNNTGTYNTAIGYSTLLSNTSGGSNAGIGAFALTNNTTGIENMAMGTNALNDNTVGNDNMAMGDGALFSNRGKSESVAIGARAMRYADSTVTPGISYNTAIGHLALRGSTTPANNTGISNTALGHSALLLLTSGSNNVAVGDRAADNLTTGSNNITIGSNLDALSATGNYQLNIGGFLYGDMANGLIYVSGTGAAKVPAGTTAQRPGVGVAVNGMIRYNSSGNNFEGYQNGLWLPFSSGGGSGVVSAIDDLTDAITRYASSNMFMGTNVGALTTGSYTTAVGVGALQGASSADYTTAFGTNALALNTTGSENSAFGSYALSSNTTGNNNTALGSGTLAANTSGSFNVAIGMDTLYNNLSGNNNIAMGPGALATNQSGSNNFAAGFHVLNLSTGSNNISILGMNAITTGQNNLALGVGALNISSSGNNNIALGHQAGDNITSGGSNILLGYDIDAQVATASNQLSIGNLIFGSGGFGTGTAVGAGRVGIRTASPRVTFDITGTDAIMIPAGTVAQRPGSTVAVNGMVRYNSDDLRFEGYQNGLWLPFSSGGGSGVVAAIDDLTDAITRYSSTSMYLGQNSGASVSNIGYGNTALGTGTLSSNTTGEFNVGIGSGAMASNTTGYRNVGVGPDALGSNIGAFSNTAVGMSALGGTTSGGNNTAMGDLALANANGYSNAAFGSQAGQNVTGSYNTLLGTAAGLNITAGDNNIIIGSEVNAATATSNYNLNIGNFITGTMSQTGPMYISSRSALKVPAGTTGERPGAGVAVNGMIRYNSTGNNFEGYQNGFWLPFSSGGGAGVVAAIDDLIDAVTRYTSGSMYLGQNSGSVITTSALNNTALGSNAMAAATNLTTSVAIGSGALSQTAQGYNHVAIGEGALSSLTGATGNNISIGAYSMAGATDGGSNIAIGTGTLFNNESGSNVAIGESALNETRARGNSVAIGYEAMRYADSTTTPGDSYSTAVGYQALRGSTTAANNTGFANTAVGHSALMNATSGQWNVAIGTQAMEASTTAGANEYAGNVAVGSLAAQSMIAGDQTVAIGNRALISATNSHRNIAIGASAMPNSVNGFSNIAIGINSMGSITTGRGNIVIGHDLDVAGGSNAHDELNIGNLITGDMYEGLMYISSVAALKVPAGTTAQRPGAGVAVNGMIRYNSSGNNFEGYQAGSWLPFSSGASVAIAIDNLTDAITQYSSNSMYLGLNSGSAVTTGMANVALGGMWAVTSGSYNVTMGGLLANTTGTGNAAFGISSLSSNISGNYNTAVGTNALLTSTASNNTAVGNDAMHFATGGNNTAVGMSALYTASTGTDNTALGNGAGYNLTTGSSNIFIGSGVNAQVATASNQMSIGNLIFASGGFGTGTTVGAGWVGIRTASPRVTFDITGTDAIMIPAGTTAQRPGSTVAANGMIRYNSSSNNFEGYQAGSWLPFSSGASVSTAIDNLTDAATNYTGSTTASSNSVHSMFLGTGVGAVATSGAAENTAAGVEAMQALTNGTWNTAFGYRALRNSTSNNANSAFGASALAVLNGGGNNTAIGEYSLPVMTTGGDNTVLGADVMMSLLTGYSNVALGSTALSSLISGSNNIAIGNLAGQNMTMGGSNIAIGTGVTFTSLTGSYQLNIGNIITGDMSGGLLYVSSTAALKVPSGTTAQRPGATSTANGMIRYNTSNTRFEGYQNGTWLPFSSGGSSAMAIDDLTDAITQYASGGSMYLGSGVGAVSGGAGNTALGYNAFTTNIAGRETTAIGYEAMRYAYDGNQATYNTAIGYRALRGSVTAANNTGIYNTAIGHGALASNTSGEGNVAVGSVLSSNTTGFGNIGLGLFTLGSNTSGSFNISMGQNAMAQNISGSGNIGIGNTSLGGLLTGGNNVAIGGGALDSLDDGILNVAIGRNAGQNMTTGFNAIIIGSDVDAVSTTADNQLNIGNTIYGDLGTDFIGIGVPVPLAQLDIGGTGSMLVPRGTTAQRPGTGINGMIRYNSSGNNFEGYQAGTWLPFSSGGSSAMAIDDLTDAITRFASTSMYFGSGVGALTTGNYNTATGIYALQAVSTGDHNTLYGGGTGYAITSGSLNTGIGADALSSVTTSGSNVALGANALLNLIGGNGANTAIGTNALYAVTGDNNTGIGYLAGDNITTGTYNIMIGSGIDAQSATGTGQLSIGNLIFGSGGLGAGTTPATGRVGIRTASPRVTFDITGTDAIMIPSGTVAQRPGSTVAVNGMVRYNSDNTRFEGYQNGTWLPFSSGGSSSAMALDDLTDVIANYTSSHNLFAGTGGTVVTSGTGNTSLGDTALANVTSGGSNNAIGYYANGSTTGISNNAFGAYSMTNTTSGSGNAGFGGSTLYNNVTGNSNTGIGQAALFANVGGHESTAIGYNAMYYAFSSSASSTRYNTAVGAFALRGSTTAANNSGTGNTVVGHSALLVNTSGSDNTAVGQNAMVANTTGSSNIAIGKGALAVNTTGSGSLAVGNGALGSNTLGGSTAIGIGAMSYNNGYTNTAVGGQAMGSGSGGATDNVAVGFSAMGILASGNQNSGVGRDAMSILTTGQYNTGMGFNVGSVLAGGSNNTFFGHTAGSNITSGSNNIAIGYATAFSSATGSNQLNIGNFITGDLTATGIMYVSSTGAFRPPSGTLAQRPGSTVATNGMMRYNTSSNNFEGYQNGTWLPFSSGGSSGSVAIDDLTDAIANYTTNHNMFFGSGSGAGILAGGTYNLVLGETAGDVITTGDNNVGLGFGVLGGVITNGNNTAVGTNALAVSTAAANTAIGYSALAADTTGNYNVAVGHQTMMNNLGGYQNVAIGEDAMLGNTAGTGQVAIGARALRGSTGAGGLDGAVAVGYEALLGSGVYFDVAVGYRALGYKSFSSRNVAIGGNALRGSSPGLGVAEENIAIGESALGLNDDGDYNVAVGRYALGVSTGSNNIALGWQAGDNITSGASNIMIGTNIDALTATASNQLSIGNLIFGSGGFGTGTSVGTGRVGIGTNNPYTKLEVNGSIKLSDGGETCNSTYRGAIRYTSVNTLQYCNATAWTSTGSGGSAPAFITLPDVPSSYSGQAGRFVQVNAGATGVQFTDQIVTSATGADPGFIALQDLTNVAISSPTNGQILSYNGSSWVNATNSGGTPAGSTTQVQYNSGGAFAANSNFVWDTTNNLLNLITSTAGSNDVLRITQTNGGGNAAAIGFYNATTTRAFAIEGWDQSLVIAGYGNSNNVSLRKAGTSTNTVLPVVDLYRYNSGGAGANGIGANTQTYLETTTDGTYNLASQLQTVATNAVSASFTTRMTMIPYYNNAATTGFTVFGSAGGTFLGVNNLTPTAGLDVNTTDAIIAPRGTTAQRPNASTAVNGMMRYNSTLTRFEGYQGGSWLPFVSSASGGGSDLNALSDVITNYTSGSMYLGNGGALNTEAESISLGSNALLSATSMTNTIAIGSGAMQNTIGGYNHVALGTAAMGNYTGFGGNNVAIGAYAMTSSTDGGGNIAIGTQTLFTTASGGNVAIGQEALSTNVGLYESIAIGNEAMKYADDTANSAPSWNIAIGARALRGSATASANTGTNNTAIGWNSMNATTTGGFNTAIGPMTLNANTTGYSNTAIGNQALLSTVTGWSNMGIGGSTLQNLTVGNNNVAIGDSALFATTGSYNNVAIGVNAGANNLTGSFNNLMGFAAGDNITSGSYNIIIGDQVDAQSATADNQLSIGNLIFAAGGFGSGTTVGTGYVGIKKAAPVVALDVTGDIQYTGVITDVSDRRLKTDILPLEKQGSMLDKFGKLNTYSFTMKSDPKHAVEFGVMAQEMKDVFPELVKTDTSTPENYMSVNYTGLIAPLVQATKELKAENDNLKTQIAAMNAEHDDMKQTLASIQKDVKGMKAYTGYGIGRAGMDGWMMLLMGVIFGGGAAAFAYKAGSRRRQG